MTILHGEVSHSSILFLGMMRECRSGSKSITTIQALNWYMTPLTYDEVFLKLSETLMGYIPVIFNCL